MTGASFEAVAADIQTSAAGMTSASETVRRVDPTADLSGVATAMEGSSSAEAASTLASTWTERFTTWADDAERHAAARRTSAAQYTRADHEAAQRMQREAWATRGTAGGVTAW